MSQAERASAPRVTPGELVALLSASQPDPTDAQAVSRWMMRLYGVPHSPIYRSSELEASLVELGLRDPMACYLAARSAPLGIVPAEVVVATFYGFSPTLVARHIPAVWDRVQPEQALAATFAAIGSIYARTLGDLRADIERAAELLRPVARLQPLAGRPLGAAWASVAWPGSAPADLWLATAIVREVRGDGHIAALVSEGIGPVESHLLARGDSGRERTALEALRGWNAEELEVAGRALRSRDLLDDEGRRTAAGERLVQHLEQITDAASAAGWAATDPATILELGAIGLRLARPLLESGEVMGPALARISRDY